VLHKVNASDKPAVEEIKDAETTAPIALGLSYALNLVLLFLVTLAIAMCAPDYDPEDPDLWMGYDPLTAVWITIDPKYALGALWSMAGVLFFALVNELACATRMTWASARDGVMPFSPYLAHTTDGIPIFAAISTVLSTSGLMTMQLYSATALAVINSLGAFAVLVSYFVLLSCVAYHRFLFPDSETKGRLLASYPYIFPGIGAAGAALMAIFLAVPLEIPITAENMYDSTPPLSLLSSTNVAS
jgi:choline transport protein